VFALASSATWLILEVLFTSPLWKENYVAKTILPLLTPAHLRRMRQQGEERFLVVLIGLSLEVSDYRILRLKSRQRNSTETGDFQIASLSLLKSIILQGK